MFTNIFSYHHACEPNTFSTSLILGLPPSYKSHHQTLPFSLSTLINSHSSHSLSLLKKSLTLISTLNSNNIMCPTKFANEFALLSLESSLFADKLANDLPQPDIHVITSAGLRIPAHYHILVFLLLFFFLNQLIYSIFNYIAYLNLKWKLLEGNGISGGGEDSGKTEKESENREECYSHSWSSLSCRFCLCAIPLFIPVSFFFLNHFLQLLLIC